MEILNNLITAIMNFNVHKWDASDERIKRSDIYAYALCLLDYLKENVDKLDNDLLFRSKFVIDYLINKRSLKLKVKDESEEEAKKCEEMLKQIDVKSREINYKGWIKTFDEFIRSLCFPQVNKCKYALEVISRENFYETADDLYRMMQLAVASPNNKLLRCYDKNYKGVKLEYIKLIAKVVTEEIAMYDLELDEASKQFIQLCEMINKYLEFETFSTHYTTASYYVNNSMDIILKKNMEKE